jgi:hypothetical protein
MKIGVGTLALFDLICLTLICLTLASAEVAQQPKVAISKPGPVYSPDVNDSWNRIFCFLFSRTMDVRLSNEFPEGAPFGKDGVDENLLRAGLLGSTLPVERNELGDRAIDPLYPGSLDSAGARLLLSDLNFTGFKKALQDALHENGSRALVARALMQSDLWSAHDILFVPFLPADEKTLGGRRRIAVDLLAQLMRKVALTPEEIKELPNNYSDANKQYPLPDLFHQESGWIETQWFPDRQHDRDAGYRRVSRIFVKPSHPPLGVQMDVQKFLDARPGQNAADLDGVALVMQLLLIDTMGNLHPTSLSNDIRLIHYGRASDGSYKKTSVQVWELSRKSLLHDPQSGGLMAQDENFPSYAVQNYNFANNYYETAGGQTHVGPPVQVRLRTRCAACHQNNNLTQVRTFAIAVPPHPPRVRQLDPTANEEAEFDITQKKKRKDFQELLSYFDRPTPSGGAR